MKENVLSRRIKAFLRVRSLEWDMAGSTSLEPPRRVG